MQMLCVDLTASSRRTPPLDRDEIQAAAEANEIYAEAFGTGNGVVAILDTSDPFAVITDDNYGCWADSDDPNFVGPQPESQEPFDDFLEYYLTTPEMLDAAFVYGGESLDGLDGLTAGVPHTLLICECHQRSSVSRSRTECTSLRHGGRQDRFPHRRPGERRASIRIPDEQTVALAA